MKKIILILLLMTLTLTFITGCSKKDTKTPSTDDNVTNNTNNQESDNENSNPVQEDNDNTNKSDVTVDDILNAIKAAYGDNYLPNMEITPELLEAEFGLTPDMYEAVKAEQPMMSTHADRVVIVKAKEGKADDVEAALINARENKINDTLQYPMNLPKINAAKVVRNSNFVCFLLVGSINDNMDSSAEDAKQFAEDEVAKAVNAFNGLFN